MRKQAHANASSRQNFMTCIWLPPEPCRCLRKMTTTLNTLSLYKRQLIPDLSCLFLKPTTSRLNPKIKSLQLPQKGELLLSWNLKLSLNHNACMFLRKFLINRKYITCNSIVIFLPNKKPCGLFNDTIIIKQSECFVVTF